MRRLTTILQRPLALVRARHRRAITATAVAVIAAIVLLTRPLAAGDPPTNDAPGSSALSPSLLTVTPSPAFSGSPGTTPAVDELASDESVETGDDGNLRMYVPPPSAPAPENAQVLVGDFVAAWLRRDLAAADWWAGVAPFCEERFAELLRTTDPGRVPAERITGPMTAVETRSDFLLADVPMDSGTLQVTVALIAGDWKVTNLDWRRR